ncbi:formyl transferase [Aestuariivirga sp.]|uniref:formyl transferase n=1 Tax=Aestuariivirga sp. TaxID=2650926 RepID=UPI0035935985
MTEVPRIAVLTVPTDHSWILINALVERFGPVSVLAEERHGKLALIRRRMRRQGVLTVLGQIGFVMLQKFIDRRQAPRIAEIVKDLALDTAPNPARHVYEIGSVNSMACRAALAMISPHVVVVAGTRIIGRQTLESIGVPVINVHMGWNPRYRGQAGGYWALAQGDPDHAGVTAHLVDDGVDTGAVLYRERFAATPQDSFGTYFYLQAGIGRSVLIRSVEDALAGRLKPVAADGPSREFFHPTLWSYLWTALRRGIW